MSNQIRRKDSNLFRYCIYAKKPILLLICGLLWLIGFVLVVSSFVVHYAKKPVVISDATSNNVQSLPLCLDRVLDRSQFIDTASSDTLLFDNKFIIRPKIKQCRLHWYTIKDVVNCLTINNGKKRLHFAFIGDSRIRQQFLNFLKLIPEYDREPNQSINERIFHDDVNVTSPLLGDLIVSFRWRPIIESGMIQDIRASYSQEPDFILIGVAVWHVLTDEDHVFQQKFNKLVSSLQQLIETSHQPVDIVCMHQYPIIEEGFVVATNNTHKHDLSSAKIYRFNQSIKKSLQNSSIRLWDSGGRMAEEYVRSCLFNKRQSGNPSLMWNSAYVNCRDSVHTGQMVLTQNTQLLYNHLCNPTLESTL